jgi:6-phosphogluconate dehydrogenase
MGPRSAGHYVKMAHNGCEYAIMQMIAETYDLLRTAFGLTAPQLAEIYDRWNQGELNSYLVEITAKVLAYDDAPTGRPLVDAILDQAGQKGTGKWTSQDAADVGVPIPAIDAALSARNMSAYKAQRVEAAKVLTGPQTTPSPLDPAYVDLTRDALFGGMVLAYAQTMALLRGASEDYGYNLHLSTIARIWKGGCIIRSKLLNPIQAAFERTPDLPNLLLDPATSELVNRLSPSLRRVIRWGIDLGVPLPGMSASLAYLDSYRRASLPVNLIQAQRDFFGAHTYQRTDKPGVFHTEWEPEA